MSEVLTYGRLHQYLRDLGFEDISVKDSHAAFRHTDSNTVILLALHQPQEPARLIDVHRVRRMLIDKGLVTAKGFDKFAAEGKLAPPRRATAN